MVSSGENWIRIFDIPDTNKHRKGFTIYKIVSMLYPISCPDAITRVTVWKRFNDFKKLHREVKVLHKKLNLKDKYPSLPSTSFFKRFNEDIVQERRENILKFLDYVGAHYQLFTSNEFVKFFQSSHTPVDQLNSNINLIRADLNLPEDPEFVVVNSDDEHTVSDTDSVTTTNSQTMDVMSDPISHNTRILSKSKLSLTHSRNSDSLSISTTTDSLTLLDGQLYPSPPHTPGTPESNVQYIVDASVHVNIAMELESSKKYEEAFTAYKTAIDILLKYGKEDKNFERKQMVRYKTEKYLIRAEKIHNMHLSSEMKNLKEITERDEEKKEETFVQRPISDLYKYKVVKIIASGMLVLHSELQQLFYIKVIHKTMKFLNDNLILPENVPYMVKLYNYYNCENALFLVLEYCSGKKLWDYIKYRSENPDDVFSNDQVLRRVQEMELSDAESEPSYSDLINEYATNKNKKSDDTENGHSSSEDSYEKVCFDDLTNKNLMDEPVPKNILVSNLVPENNELPPSSQRKFSELSSFDDSDFDQNFGIPIQNIIKWSAQLLLALEKLHALGIICRDLQSHNLIINEDGDLTLTYMCNVTHINDVFNSGKSLNLAPEVYSFQAVTKAVDWWCFGAILYELLVGMPLSTIHSEGLTRYTNLKVPKYVSPEGKSLLKQLLVFEPRERLGSGANGIEALKSHPFFNSVAWDKLLVKYNC